MDDYQSTQIANPATDYCIKNGGDIEFRITSEGEMGYCVFEDGSACEEWAYYRGECEPKGEDPEGDDCGTVSPGSRDECCERKMKGVAPRLMCVGSWEYDEKTGECEYNC